MLQGERIPAVAPHAVAAPVSRPCPLSPSFPRSQPSERGRPDVFPHTHPTHQALEKHKRKPEALRGWCIYWVVIALYTVGAQYIGSQKTNRSAICAPTVYRAMTTQ